MQLRQKQKLTGLKQGKKKKEKRKYLSCSAFYWWIHIK